MLKYSEKDYNTISSTDSNKEKLKTHPIKCFCFIAASPSLLPRNFPADAGLLCDVVSVLSKAIKKTLQLSIP
jgi:hypothetical protein